MLSVIPSNTSATGITLPPAKSFPRIKSTGLMGKTQSTATSKPPPPLSLAPVAPCERIRKTKRGNKYDCHELLFIWNNKLEIQLFYLNFWKSKETVFYLLMFDNNLIFGFHQNSPLICKSSMTHFTLVFVDQGIIFRRCKQAPRLPLATPIWAKSKIVSAHQGWWC